MSRRLFSFTSFILLAPQFLVVDSGYSFKSDPDRDSPGHSGRWNVIGPSGFGCQARDSEVIPHRTPDRKGEDDGTLWTGETILHISRLHAEDEGSPGTVCNGTFYMPTLFWIGPYLQGENGTDGNFALGMLSFETNSTDKSDVWHVYRSCLDFDDSIDSSPGTYQPYTSAFEFKAAAHYNRNAKPPDNSTIGLNLVPRPPGSDAPKSSSPQIFFNGTYNGVKESEEYFNSKGFDYFDFSSRTELNCSRASNSSSKSKNKNGEGSFKPPSGADGKFLPGSSINGSLSNDTVALRIVGSETYDLLGATDITFARTDIDLTFTGRYDARNSSQNLILNTTSGPAIRFSAGTRRMPSLSLMIGILVPLSLCFL